MNRRLLLTGLTTLPLTSALAAETVVASVAGKTLAGPRAGYFPNALLTTHEGTHVRFYDDLIKGDKIVTFNMMYTRCTGICPGMTANLVRVQKLLADRVGRDVFMYSLSLKPEEDTPALLKEYAEMHGVGPGWTFLTGAANDVEQLRRKLGFKDPEPRFDADIEQHIGLVRFGNEALDRWAACPASANPERIAESILWMQSPKA